MRRRKSTKNQVRTIAKEPGGVWHEVYVENTLPAFQEMVDGFVETVSLPDGAIIICDEEGRLKRKKYCCTILGISLVGTVLILGIKDGEFADCPYSLDEWMSII